MGTIRFLLSISVVFFHTAGVHLVGGKNAVQMFYMVSGFLISYILVGERKYDSAGRFLLNRFLRIYPSYLLVALLTLSIYVAFPFLESSKGFFAIYDSVTIEARMLLVFSNAFIFLQDLVLFLRASASDTFFITAGQGSELWPGLLVPQAWSLSVELFFYLLAPWVLLERRRVILVLALSFLVRLLTIYLGMGMKDPWTYRFLPSELFFFMLGALAHQVLLQNYEKRDFFRKGNLAFAVTWIMVFVIVVYSYLPVSELLKSGVLIVFFFMALPFLFQFQKGREWDRHLGELSYPIYIIHLLIVFILQDSSMNAYKATGFSYSMQVILVTCLLSWALVRYFERPINVIRSRVARRA